MCARSETSADTLEGRLDAALKAIYPERDVVVIARLWGLDGGGGESLQSVAADLGLTRERIRQVSERAIQKLKADYALKAKITRVIRSTAGRTPATFTEIEIELHRLKMVDGTLRLGSILAAADSLGIHIPFAATPVGAETVVHDSQIPSLWPLESAARALTATQGAAQFRAVMRRAAVADRRLGRSALARVVLSCCDGFRWLDESSGWFFLTSVSGNRLWKQIRKVLAIVDSIAIADLKTRVGRDRKTPRPDLPDAVFRELCRQPPWLSVEDQSVRSRMAIQPERVLSNTELGLLRMLRDAGGALSHSDIISRCDEYRINPGTVLQRLLFSPIIQRYGRARYGLVGAGAAVPHVR